jgi:hypothetical protein
MNLVCGDGHQVDRHGTPVDLDLADGLCGVDVQKHAARPADRGQRANVLDHPGLVVDPHHRGEQRARLQRGGEALGIKQTVVPDLQNADRHAFPLQRAQGLQHRRVLGLHRHDVVVPARRGLRDAFQREVIGLGRTRGPDDLGRLAADQHGELLARDLDRLFGAPAPDMRARRGIAEPFVEVRQHLRNDARIDLGRRRVVEVDRLLHLCSLRALARHTIAASCV